MAGTFAVDGEGVVRWAKAAERADDVPDLDAAVGSLFEGGSEGKGSSG